MPAASSDENEPCASSAAEKAVAVWNRSAGSLASALSTACSTLGGTVSRTVPRGACLSVMIRPTIACTVAPVNGGWPASIS